jgi:hypothetical protein
MSLNYKSNVFAQAPAKFRYTEHTGNFIEIRHPLFRAEPYIIVYTHPVDQCTFSPFFRVVANILVLLYIMGKYGDPPYIH